MSETSMLEAIKNWLMRRGKSASSNLVIIDCGSGNIRRYIDVSYIASALDVKHNGLVTSIPGLHAFNGCDFIAAFYNQKKVKALEILEREDTVGTFTEFFGSMTSIENPNQTIAEEFLCSLYGMKDIKDVNEARYANYF